MKTVDKVAVITGAAGGIGEALADEAKTRGYRLALSDVDEDALERLRLKHSSETLIQKLDVSDANAMAAFSENVFEQFGRVDALFNNAGVFATGRIWEQSSQNWSWVMNVNFNGVLNGVQSFVPHIIKAGHAAHIVNTSSMSGLSVFPMVAAYSVSKHAVVALSEALHYELEAEDASIQVSVICPGAVQTDILNPDRHGVKSDRTDEADEYLSKMQKGLSESGMQPDQLASFVFEEMTAGKFWITPHPDMLAPVMTRAENILSGTNPAFTMTRTRKPAGAGEKE